MGCSCGPWASLEWTQGLSLHAPTVVSLGEHPELRGNLLPPLIIHTAATPMSLPKSSSTGLAEALGPASRCTSSSGSAEPGTAHEVKSPVSVHVGAGQWDMLGVKREEWMDVDRPMGTAPASWARQAPWGSVGLVMQVEEPWPWGQKGRI